VCKDALRLNSDQYHERDETEGLDELADTDSGGFDDEEQKPKRGMRRSTVGMYCHSVQVHNTCSPFRDVAIAKSLLLCMRDTVCDVMEQGYKILKIARWSCRYIVRDTWDRS